MTERWKPEFDEMYWSIPADGKVILFCWRDDEIDRTCFNFGNCFRTEEEAEAAAEKVKDLLLDLHKNPENLRTSPEHSQKVSRSTPDYYKRFFKDVEIQVNDIAHLWNLDSDEAQAVQYILRARYKNDGNDELQDLRKAVNMLNMAIKWKEIDHARE
ncbi:hypothetical protein [Faecalibaculum rodentium]|uniref:hypothetical protein n=1 Tax=Faecalibaculum rodentium TaxID=1702221 RepID=UPI00272D8539|nr:hypothetical protein [Faecalibaculum rodentium]